jgi:hypothetical protein
MNPVLSKHPLWCFVQLPPLLQAFLVRISSELEQAFMVENSVGKKFRSSVYTRKYFHESCRENVQEKRKSRGSLNKCAKNLISFAKLFCNHNKN